MKLARRTGLTPEIPTASMADIAFLLIVFFMVTSTIAATKGLEFRLPSPSDDPASAEQQAAVYIHVRPAGVFVDCKRMELSEILPYLKPKLESWANKPVILHTDPAAQYGKMVAVYDELSKAREVLGRDITNISIPTSSEIETYVQAFGYNPFTEGCDP